MTLTWGQSLQTTLGISSSPEACGVRGREGQRGGRGSEPTPICSGEMSRELASLVFSERKAHGEGERVALQQWATWDRFRASAAAVWLCPVGSGRPPPLTRETPQALQEHRRSRKFAFPPWPAGCPRRKLTRQQPPTRFRFRTGEAGLPFSEVRETTLRRCPIACHSDPPGLLKRLARTGGGGSHRLDGCQQGADDRGALEGVVGVLEAGDRPKQPCGRCPALTAPPAVLKRPPHTFLACNGAEGAAARGRVSHIWVEEPIQGSLRPPACPAPHQSRPPSWRPPPNTRAHTQTRSPACLARSSLTSDGPT